MSNASQGIVLLPATIQLCSTLARLATGLDKRPDLTSNLRKRANNDQGEKKTLVESTAELIQRAFTICLTERTTNRNGIGRDGKPEGKKIGIYSFANMVLKLLFQVRPSKCCCKHISDTYHSGGRHGLRTSYSTIFLRTHHLSPYTQRVIESSSSTFSAGITSPTVTSSMLNSACSQRTTNVIVKTFPTDEPSSFTSFPQT
jgi:hypothetical protein